MLRFIYSNLAFLTCTGMSLDLPFARNDLAFVHLRPSSYQFLYPCRVSLRSTGFVIDRIGCVWCFWWSLAFWNQTQFWKFNDILWFWIFLVLWTCFCYDEASMFLLVNSLSSFCGIPKFSLFCLLLDSFYFLL